MIIEKDQIKLDLSVVSSILRNTGHKGLLNYLSLETYKRIVKEEYVDFQKFTEYSFLKNEKDWIEANKKLVGLKLMVQNGTHFITRVKLKEWKQYSTQNDPKPLTLNGFIVFNMSELYKLKNNPDLKDLIILSVIQNVTKGRSVSREFIQTLTGLKAHQQQKLAERNPELIKTLETIIPINEIEERNIVNKNKIFSGVYLPQLIKCKKATKKYSNCKIAQQGNRYKIKDLGFSFFEYKKSSVSYTRPPNNFLLDKKEVRDWEDFDIVLDASKNSDTIRLRGIINMKDKKETSWKDFKTYDTQNVGVLKENGILTNLRSILTR